MKASEGKLGRVFVIRLEDGDALPTSIEKFAEEKGIRVGHAILVGGIAEGQIVVGPRYSRKMPPEPMLLPIDGAHEVAGVGVLAPAKMVSPCCTCTQPWAAADRRWPAACVPVSPPG